VINVQFRKTVLAALVLPILLCVVIETARAQSVDQSLPTPVLSFEINGRISPRDLGDARLTRHFYAFEGNPGDLLITMDSKNLNGDIDIFTAVTFRPLMKTSIYANTQVPLGVTKGIYLRAHQIFILRVEARSPNDEEGIYHVRFGGSFAPFSGGIPVAENTEAESESDSTRGTKRLSSVGATIAEPVVETPPAAETKPDENTAEKPAEDTTAAKKPSAKARPTRSTARNTRRRTPPPAKPKPAKADTEAAKTSETKTEETKAGEPKTEAGEEKSPSDSAKSETPAKPNAQEVPLPGAHLIIESKDGTKIDRPMSTIRRVVVEGGMIVVVSKTGKIERIPMSAVARMAIEP
jgi:hypothetical protein